MKYSRHGPGLDLTKGVVLLDGPSFQGKPKNGLSIATWFKLSNIEGNHVIFSSTSSKELLSKTSYLFNIQDGRLHWSHQNEIGENVFVVVSPLVIGPYIWNHVVVTYDSFSEKAKVLVNGKVKAVGRGHGKLSDQWGDSTYFGSNSKAFNGYLDEVYIFKRPLHNSEVKQYLSNMDGRNYGLNNISKVTLLRKEQDFPSIASSKRLESMLNSPSKKVVKLKVSDRPLNSTTSFGQNSNSTLKNTSNKTLEENQRGIPTDTKFKDPKFKGLFSELKAATLPNIANFACAVNGTVHEKMTFRGGLKSGRFFKIADVSDTKNCISQCCDRSTCDAAILKETTCFALTCRNKKLCELQPAKLSSFDLKIAFVKRSPKEALNQSDHGNASLSEDNSQSHQRISSPSDKCLPGIRVTNVTINAGVGAGQVVQYRNISKIDQCVSQCCSMPKCNTAFLVQNTCYVIACVIKDFCKVRPPPNENFLSEVVYVNRSGKMLFNDPQSALALPSKFVSQTHKTAVDVHTMKNTTYTSNVKLKQPQNDSKEHKDGIKGNKGVQKQRRLHNLTKTYTTETECRVESIQTDVRLAGELNAGVFVDHGVVRGIKSCIIKCCRDPLCNVTYMIGKKCFAVRCHNAELCKTVPGLPKALSPTIAFVRQEKLRGKLIYLKCPCKFSLLATYALTTECNKFVGFIGMVYLFVVTSGVFV